MPPPGYRPDLVGDPCVVVLHREDGTVLARFSDHAVPEEIRRAAEKDRRRPHETRRIAGFHLSSTRGPVG